MFEDETKRDLADSLQYKKASRMSGIQAPAGFNSNQLSSSGDFELTASNAKKQGDTLNSTGHKSPSPALALQEEHLHTGNFAIDTTRFPNTARDSVREISSNISAAIEPNPRVSVMSYSDLDDDPRYLLCTCSLQDPNHKDCECIDQNYGANYKLMVHIHKAKAVAYERWEQEIRDTYQGGGQFDWDALDALEKVDDKLE